MLEDSIREFFYNVEVENLFLRHKSEALKETCDKFEYIQIKNFM